MADELTASGVDVALPHPAPGTRFPVSARLRGYLRLLHPFPVAANGVAAAAFGAVAVRGWPGGRTTLLLVLAIIGSQATVGVVNDLRDRDLDATEKPHKPLIAGRCSLPGAYALGTGMFLISVVAGALLGPVSLLLVLAMTAAGLVYDLWLKRTAASFVPYVLGLPILPVWAWVCVRDAPPRLWLTYPLGVLIGFGLHLANALPDAERDARGGVRGLVQIAGKRNALALCFGTFALALVAVIALTWGHASALIVALLALAAALGVGALIGTIVRPTVVVLQRNWGLLIGCALCIAVGWLAAL